MQPQTSQPKPEKLALPVASHDTSILLLYKWLQDKVEDMDYGTVGLEFVIHKGVVTRVHRKEETNTPMSALLDGYDL